MSDYSRIKLGVALVKRINSFALNMLKIKSGDFERSCVLECFENYKRAV